MIDRPRTISLSACIVAVACQAPQPEVEDTSTGAVARSVVPKTPAPPPIRSSSPLPQAPFCIPSGLFLVDRSKLSESGRALEFCIGGSDQPGRVCASLDLSTGEYARAPLQPVRDPEAPPPPGPRPSSDGAWTVETTNTAVKICRSDGTDCHVVAIRAFTPTALASSLGGPNIPADVSADGATLFIIRHEGGRGEKIFGETYDVATGRRIARGSVRTWGGPNPVLDYVPRAEWLGPVVLVHDCNERRRRAICVSTLVEPRTMEVRGLALDMEDHDGNVYSLGTCATSRTAFHVRDDVWAFFDCTADYAIWKDVRAVWKDIAHPGLAKGKPLIIVGPGEYEGGGAGYVRRPGTNELFVVNEGLASGAVFQYDLSKREAVKDYSPPRCN